MVGCIPTSLQHCIGVLSTSRYVMAIYPSSIIILYNNVRSSIKYFSDKLSWSDMSVHKLYSTKFALFPPHLLMWVIPNFQLINNIANFLPWLEYIYLFLPKQIQHYRTLKEVTTTNKQTWSICIWLRTNLHNRSSSNKNVLGLHITVDDTIRVQVVQCSYLKVIVITRLREYSNFIQLNDAKSLHNIILR